MNIAGFGWQLSPLKNDGGSVIFKVASPITLNFLTMDASFALVNIGLVPEPIEVLFQAIGGSAFGVGPAPRFPIATPNDPRVVFSGTVKDPPLVYAPDPAISPTFMQSILAAMTMKVDATPNGTSCATGRNITVNPNLALATGDTLAFHIEHTGSSLAKAEMQIVIGYS